MKSSTSTIYERNLFYQQLNFKYAMLLYLHSTVWKLKSDKSQRTKLLTLLFILLYLIDFAIGGIVLLFFIRNPTLKYQVGNILSLYTKTILKWSEEYLVWLMGVPWGIKLNTPLSQFLGTRYLYILDLWKLFYSEFISIYLLMFVDFLLILLPFGFTLSITALHDFLKFLNLCLICFFVISNRVFTLQVSALKSLGRLFMGKKWNILRERVDSCDFNMNQLLVGTIVFTILLFLLPTTGMYTLAFLYLRLVQFSVQFNLRICAVFVNKITFSALSSLYSSLQDEPLSRAKVLITGLRPEVYAKRKMGQPYRVVDGKWCKLECFSVDDEDISVLWNGNEYSVEEMREIVDGLSEEEMAKDFEHSTTGTRTGPLDASDDVEARTSAHPMMHWFWTLPKN